VPPSSYVSPFGLSWLRLVQGDFFSFPPPRYDRDFRAKGSFFFFLLYLSPLSYPRGKIGFFWFSPPPPVAMSSPPLIFVRFQTRHATFPPLLQLSPSLFFSPVSRKRWAHCALSFSSFLAADFGSPTSPPSGSFFFSFFFNAYQLLRGFELTVFPLHKQERFFLFSPSPLLDVVKKGEFDGRRNVPPFFRAFFSTLVQEINVGARHFFLP